MGSIVPPSTGKEDSSHDPAGLLRVVLGTLVGLGLHSGFVLMSGMFTCQWQDRQRSGNLGLA